MARKPRSLGASILADLDAWRAAHPEKPSREEALRMLVASTEIAPIASATKPADPRRHPVGVSAHLV